MALPPLATPNKCASCREKLEGKTGAIVFAVCVDCVEEPKTDIAKLVMKEWREKDHDIEADNTRGVQREESHRPGDRGKRQD